MLQEALKLLPDNMRARLRIKLAQKDLEARWAKKGAETHFGCKNHIKMDKASKIITK